MLHEYHHFMWQSMVAMYTSQNSLPRPCVPVSTASSLPSGYSAAHLSFINDGAASLRKKAASYVTHDLILIFKRTKKQPHR